MNIIKSSFNEVWHPAVTYQFNPSFPIFFPEEEED